MIGTFLLSLLLGTLLSVPALAEKTDLKDLKKTIVKIILYMPEGTAVATAFAISNNGEKLLVTNNHVCDGFYKAKRVLLVESQTRTQIPYESKDFENLDNVTDYYMDPGTDICILKSQHIDKYHGLELNSENASPTEDILIAGFVGRSLDLMYVTGKVYGTVPIEHPLELKDCLFNPPQDSSEQMTCGFFPMYPTYVTKTLQTAVNNIGPGFSGSPVLQNGKVSGIVCRYFQPAQGYSNGDVIFFPLNDLRDAIKRSSKSLVKVDSTQYVKFIKISEFDGELRQYLKETEEDLKKMIPKMLRRYNDG